MGLNKQSGNMYAFVSHTWNPIKGHCPHECCYCYMKRFSVGDLRLDRKELKTKLGKDNFIFVGSGTDAFCEDVLSNWINEVLEYCNQFDNTYLFQSKNPSRFKEFIDKYPGKTVLGTTIETDSLPNSISKAPKIKERVRAMRYLSRYEFKTMVTIEPIIDFKLRPFLDLIQLCNPAWVNIGADSKAGNLPEPSKQKVKNLVLGLKKFTEVHVKNNLWRLYGS